MKQIDEKTIKLDRELSELDKSVLKFIRLLQKHADYVLISGYVAILFGRSRGTEDVDFLIEKVSEEKFAAFYADLLRNGFWAINADSVEELYGMLKERLAVRFAEKDIIIPNFEVKFVKDALDEFTLKEKIKVVTKKGDIFISILGLQVAYKKYVLGSPKDLEDAVHLQKLFKLPEETINKYKLLLKEYGRI